MAKLDFYFAPGTCGRAIMIALEEAQADFDIKLVVYMRGEHKSPSYLSMNPNGKVPMLLADGTPITETSGILLYLAHAFPEAALLPLGKNAIDDAVTVSHLIWCSSELHPNVFRIRIPQYFCDEPQGRERQKAMAMDTMHMKFAIVENRLKNGPWFLGETWSVVDAYLFWVWFRLENTGFDQSIYPFFARHHERMKQRPSVQRALERERVLAAELQAQGLVVNFDTFRPGKRPEDFVAQQAESKGPQNGPKNARGQAG